MAVSRNCSARRCLRASSASERSLFSSARSARGSESSSEAWRPYMSVASNRSRLGVTPREEDTLLETQLKRRARGASRRYRVELRATERRRSARPIILFAATLNFQLNVHRFLPSPLLSNAQGTQTLRLQVLLGKVGGPAEKKPSSTCNPSQCAALALHSHVQLHV